MEKLYINEKCNTLFYSYVLVTDILEMNICHIDNKKTHKVKWREYYNFLSKEPIYSKWKNLLFYKCGSIKRCFLVMCVKLRLTWLLELVYKIYRILKV